MANPPLEALQRDLGQLLNEGANVVSIYKDIQLPIDETAATIFRKVRRGVNSFVFEFGEFKKGN
jgi:hypothetical protein